MTEDVTTQPSAAESPPLEMRGITKRYPGVVANDGINLVVRAGEIHALLGENGAGKTTLMNVLYGLAVPDAGEILLDGEPVTIRSPHDAIGRGISMVHQHFMLVPVLSVVAVSSPQKWPNSSLAKRSADNAAQLRHTKTFSDRGLLL